MALKITNGATSTLAGNIGLGDTAISIQAPDQAKFPVLGVGDWHPLTIVDPANNKEIVKVTARVGAVLTVVRAQEGTTAKAFNSGASVSLRLTAKAFETLQNMSDLPNVVTTRTNLGMERVSNTNDAEKPLSDASVAALAALDAEHTAVEIALGAEIDALEASLMQRMPVGAPLTWLMPTPPTGWFERDGTLLSRVTYAALWAVLKKEAAVTITIANPAVVTWNAHGRAAGDKVRLYTTGALATGLAVNTDYFIIAAGLTANAFQLSATLGGAAIITTGAQNGVHTCRFAPHGHGDGLTTFPLPDDRGIHERYWDHGRGTADAGRIFASEQLDDLKTHLHAFVGNAQPDHVHTKTGFGRYGANGDPYTDWQPSAGDSGGDHQVLTTDPAGGFTPSGAIGSTGIAENRVRNRAYLPIIKYN